MAANVETSQEENGKLNASMQLNKSPEGEISKVLSNDQFIHGPNVSEGQHANRI